MNIQTIKSVSTLVLLLCAPGAVAQHHDNDQLRKDMNRALGTHNTAVLAGLVSSGPFGTAVELTELAANLQLKALPPILDAPASIEVYPDMLGNGEYACDFSYNLPQQSAVYEDLLGLGTIRKLPTDWGPFGTPGVEHRHSGVQVTLAGAAAGPGVLNEGDHLLTWIAETQLSPFWDIYFPSSLAAFGIASEARNGKTILRAGNRLTQAGTRRARSLKERLVKVAIEIGKEAAITGAEFLTDDTPGLLGDEEPSAMHARPQSFRVWDVHPPVFTDPDTQQIIESQTISVEAADFGGARFRRIEKLLTQQFDYVDNCGRRVALRADNPPSLIPIGETGVDIEWLIDDQGIYNHGDLRFAPAPNQELYNETSLRTRLVQRVIVQDTQPPLLLIPDSFAEYTEADIVLNGDTTRLGKISVVDLADPDPTVTNDAPAVLHAPTVEEGGRRYFIEYVAEDDSGNRTIADAGNPEQYTQIVTLKWPGTNTVPEAADATAATVSNEPVSIRLTGADSDLIDGRVDPLVFKIADQPANGEFVAPLYPYFIEDFRSKPVETPRDMDPATLACPVGEDLQDGRVLESKLGLLDINDHYDYVTRCYCGQNIDPPTDYVNQPDYIHIADDDLSYISDDPFVCDPSTGGTASTTEPRISTWLNGELQKELYPQFNSSNNSRLFDVDEEGRVWLLRIGTPTGSSANVFVQTWDRNLELWYPGDGQTPPTRTALNVTGSSNPFRPIDPARLVSAHVDVDNNVIYVSEKESVMVFSLYGPVDRPALADMLPATEFTGLNVNVIGEGNCDTGGGVGSSAGFTMNTDSAGNLFVADTCAHKIHKFEPSRIDVGGDLELGDYVGWMGRCIGNAADPATGVEYNNCVVDDQHSNGFTCTDETCIEDPGLGGRAGSGPGQFEIVSHLNIDPNDTLYVADFRNQRIQRFGADGVFAGEAQSVGGGITNDSSFVLGNMGPPSHVSVNSDSFHVLESRDETGDFFLHIFKTLPFYDITADSARVDYVSGINFRGTDRFTYFVDDGIDASALATVSVDVGATRRPPENLRTECFADAGLLTRTPCVMPEDGDIYLRLVSSDPDGFVGFGGFDTHTFTILEEPVHGQLELQSANANNAVYRYRPAEHFHGNDGFSFNASDGTGSAAEPGLAEIVITPVDDPVEITVPAEMQIPRGFKQFFQFEFDDPDHDATAPLVAHSVDWGDGVFAGASQGWQNIGIVDDDGNPIDPQRDTLPGRGFIVGAHTFTNPTIGFSVCMTDSGNTVCNDLQGSSNLVLEDVTHVTVARAGDDDIQPDTDTAIRISVTNDMPEGWPGFAADATALRITPPAGVTIVGVPAGCSVAAAIDCLLGSLAVGETRSIDLVIRADLETARENPVLVFRTEQTDAGPRLDDVSHASFQVEVSDRDGDGVIDVDDAFPDDDRYSRDDDGDGIADAWEEESGLDPANDDSALDPDGDGFDHLAEFELGGHPLLVDSYLASALLSSGVEDLQSSDHFGISLGAGDVDNDGFMDVAIGAPAYEGGGAVFIYRGVDPVANESLQRIDAGGLTDFGRSVAVGDLDGNGFADLAVGSANGVSVFLATAGGMPTTPSLVLTEDATDGMGQAVAIADLDDDGLNDLIWSTPNRSGSVAGQGEVSVLRASDNWWKNPNPFPSKTFTGPAISNFRLGQSLAVGDIDNDGRADLLVGSVHGNGHVYVYRGSSRDWNQPVRTTPDFIIDGEEDGDRFGFAIATGSDVDVDGTDDLVVGAYRADGTGAAYVYASSAEYWTQLNPAFAQKLAGESAGDQLGVRVTMVDPSPGKSGADIVVGANRSEQGEAVDEGSLHLFNGGSLPVAGIAAIAGTPHDMLGYYVLGTGDINGDGAQDFAAGAPDINLSGYNGDGGYVRLYFGGRSEPQTDADGDNVADSLDNCPADANTAQADGDGDGAGDFCDAFPSDALYARDADEDGLPDAYESDNGLDPNDPADATGDLDGDGRNNLDEFLAGADIGKDDVPPVVSPPPDLVVDASGILTPVEVGTASADDALDGAVATTLDQNGPYASGRHLLIWAATDAAGNTASAVQRLDVLPMADFVGAFREMPEGSTGFVEIELSGDAPEYPVQVSLAASGDAAAGVDYVLASNSVAIGPENRALIALEVLQDTETEGTEALEFDIADISNGSLGNISSQTVHIVEGNVLPALRLSAAQGGKLASTVITGGGDVQLEITIDDPNALDSHLIDWSGTDTALVPQEGFNSTTFTFDPSGLAAGTYRVRVSVIDSGDLLSPVATGRLIQVADIAPELSNDSDQDDDGIGDLDEGAGDADMDGVPDYLDSSNRPSRLARQSGKPAALQTDPGLVLKLGSTAFASGDDAAVTMEDIALFGDNGKPAQSAADQNYAYLAGLVDFEVHGLPVRGAIARIVVPLPASIPSEAGYRKYFTNIGWGNFVQDSDNALASAPGRPGACPAPGDTSYRAGLAEGDHCLQLTIADGGPNDADGSANRIILDPGGVSMQMSSPAVSISPRSVADPTVSAGDSEVLMLRFHLNANTGGTRLGSITLTASGSGNDATDIRNVALWYDADRSGTITTGDTEIGRGTYPANDGALELTPTVEFDIPSGDSEYLVTYDF